MRDWQPITSAPFDRDLQLSVIEKEEVYALIFPCRQDTNWMGQCENRKTSFRGAYPLAYVVRRVRMLRVSSKITCQSRFSVGSLANLASSSASSLAMSPSSQRRFRSSISSDNT